MVKKRYSLSIESRASISRRRLGWLSKTADIGLLNMQQRLANDNDQKQNRLRKSDEKSVIIATMAACFRYVMF